MTAALAPALGNHSGLLGNTLPRVWTRPLITGPPGPCSCGCALDRDTSYGFAVIDFARDVLREPLDPWQEFFVIHAGELLEDGRPRFRTVLLLVARQNGKTEVCKILMLYWLYIERWPMMLGTSTKLAYARETWAKAVRQAKRIPVLKAEIGEVRRTNGEQCLTIGDEEDEDVEDVSRYQIAASNDEGGRSLSIDRLLQDELRSHHTWDAWNAATFAQNARPYAQNFGVSNAGGDKSLVLNSLQDSAVAGTDPRLGIFEWSAPEGMDIMDPVGWCAANPNLGRRLDVDTVAGAAARAKEKGGKEEASFKTEVLCRRVKTLDAAVDPSKWAASAVPGDLAAVRRRVALVIDVSLDGLHATLCAAAVVSPGITRVEVVEAWDGIGCSKQVARDLPGLVAKIRPRVIGWFPNGPAAEMAVDMGKTKRVGWPAKGVKVEEIKTDMPAVCMGFAAQVVGEAILQPDDPLLNAHTLAAEKLWQGVRWVFSRKGGHCDALYAAAGAVHLARTLPAASSTHVPVSTEVANELARKRAERDGQLQ